VKSRLGSRVIPAPDILPFNGSGNPGDDDTPSRDGMGGLGTPPPGADTVNSNASRKFWSMRDLVAWLRLHAFDMLRARR
jgi:hypothetical protein